MTSPLPLQAQAAEAEAASAGIAAAQAEIERLEAASAAASREAAQQLSDQRAHSDALAAELRAEAKALRASVDAGRAEAAATHDRAAAAEALTLDRAAELAACVAERDRAVACISSLQARLAYLSCKFHKAVVLFTVDLLQSLWSFRNILYLNGPFQHLLAVQTATCLPRPSANRDFKLHASHMCSIAQKMTMCFVMRAGGGSGQGARGDRGAGEAVDLRGRSCGSAWRAGQHQGRACRAGFSATSAGEGSHERPDSMREAKKTYS